MMRPYIICHMVTSIDGKVTGDFLYDKQCEAATELYYQINRDFKADAFACGRVTMEGSFTQGLKPDLSRFAGIAIPREDYLADSTARYFAVAFDRRGQLGWQTPVIVDDDPGYGGAHILEVMCEDAPDEYLAYLRNIGVSYIFAGKEELDLPLALQKLYELFGIRTLLLEGGSILNGAFQREHMVDELSLVMAPVIAEAEDKPLFRDSVTSSWALMNITTYEDGVLWLRYKQK